MNSKKKKKKIEQTITVECSSTDNQQQQYIEKKQSFKSRLMRQYVQVCKNAIKIEQHEQATITDQY